MHPAPEVPARSATDAELPRNASATVKAAEKLDWQATALYARGTDMSAEGEVKMISPDDGSRVYAGALRSGVPAIPLVVESLVVKLSRGPWRAVAVWIDGSFSSAYVWRRGRMAFEVGYRRLRTLLAELPTETPVGSALSEGSAS